MAPTRVWYFPSRVEDIEVMCRVAELLQETECFKWLNWAQMVSVMEDGFRSVCGITMLLFFFPQVLWVLFTSCSPISAHCYHRRCSFSQFHLCVLFSFLFLFFFSTPPFSFIRLGRKLLWHCNFSSCLRWFVSIYKLGLACLGPRQEVNQLRGFNLSINMSLIT